MRRGLHPHPHPPFLVPFPPSGPPRALLSEQAVTASEAMPALLATCFALYYTHCISQRRSPFPGPFRYDRRTVPSNRSWCVNDMVYARSDVVVVDGQTRRCV